MFKCSSSLFLGAFGGAGGIGWGLEAGGVNPGFVDATRFEMPADYLLPKYSPEYWASHKNDLRLPIYQGSIMLIHLSITLLCFITSPPSLRIGSNIFVNGGFKGLRGRSLSRFRGANPFTDPKVMLFNPLNHPDWFFPNALDPNVPPYFIQNRFSKSPFRFFCNRC
jgi:hypothetical protein